MERRAKREDVAETVAELAETDRVVLTDHAERRMRQRGVTLPEVRGVLLSGIRVPEQDEWHEDERAWAYALEGTNHEGRQLRVAVSFDIGENAVVVTVVTPDG